MDRIRRPTKFGTTTAMPDEEKSGPSLRITSRRADEALIALVQGWTIETILLPPESHRAGKRTYFPWIGIGRKTDSVLIYVDDPGHRPGYDDFLLKVKPLDETETVDRRIQLKNGYYIGLETLYFDMDSEEDPSRIGAVRVYDTGYNLRLEFGLSHHISTLMYLEEFELNAPV